MLPLSRRQVLEKTAGAAILAATPRVARGDTYPSRPIRLVIPFAAGGSNDQIGRPWANKIGSMLGPAFVENIGGAGGALGCSSVARSTPDGYSLLLGNLGNQVVIPLASTHPGYDPERDFRGVCRLVTSSIAFAVHPSLPVHDLRELIAYAKDNPGKLSYGSAGVGTTNHLVGEMFKKQSGAGDIVHVPYRGAGPATNDLMGGQILLVVAIVSGQLLELNKAGKLRIIAITNEKRLSGAPDIPTAIESGMPDLKLEVWFGLFAPKATTDAVVSRIAQATRAAMSDSSLLDAYRSQGMEPDDQSTPDAFQSLVEAERSRLEPVIKSIGFKVD